LRFPTAGKQAAGTDSPTRFVYRAEILCRFVIDEVIEPVGHRQLVFVLPRHLRRPFYRDRKLLTGLCRSSVEATHAFYRASLGRDDLRVGKVVLAQRFGERVNPHIHLHLGGCKMPGEILTRDKKGQNIL
jgi:hypothetical protein